MSPASQGNLDVEHYTGSTLISARVGHKGKKSGEGKGNRPVQDQYQHHHLSYPHHTNLVNCDRGGYNKHMHHGGGSWTGLPLISIANPRRHTKPPRHVITEDRTPLSRLAIHTQGAPLILSGRYSNSNRKNHGRPANRSNKYKDNSNGPADCLSIASDESSGSGQSENCLPRIIKPRKRRKKDRKPSGTDVPKSDETVDKEIVVPNSCEESNTSAVLKQSLDNSLKDDEQHDPKLVHKFEDVKDTNEEATAASVCSPASCQCRCCDPSGIWDAPVSLIRSRPASSVFLTPPAEPRYEYPSVKDLALRRSWSEPTRHSQLGGGSLEWPDSVGDQWQSLKGCDIDSKSEKESSVNSLFNNHVNYDSLSLQVSTEIVTSLNGHRDLEIKFFSSSPNDSIVVNN